MRLIATVGASLIVTACAATPEQRLSAHLDSNLDALAGQPVAVAVGRLGEPSGSARIGADTIVSWQQAFESQVTTTPPTMTTVNVVTPILVSRQTEVVSNRCLVQAVVDPDGLIRYWHFEGNYAGCRPYAERLRAQAGAE